MENVVFTLCFTVFYVFLWNGLINRTSIFIAEELDVCPCWNRKILHIPWMTKDVWNMRNHVATSSNQATSSRIQHHPTHFTWRYYTPPTPPPPFCKQQRNLQRSNIFQPSNIFQDSTSSNALHMTLLHPPHPPHPPFCKQQRNLQRSNIFQPSNIFQDSTSSNALHMTL